MKSIKEAWFYQTIIQATESDDKGIDKRYPETGNTSMPQSAVLRIL